MNPTAILMRELAAEQRPHPWTQAQARIDLALIPTYPPPDCTQLLEPRRLARRWGWRISRVLRLQERPAAVEPARVPRPAVVAPEASQALGSATVTVHLRPRVRR